MILYSTIFSPLSGCCLFVCLYLIPVKILTYPNLSVKDKNKEEKKENQGLLARMV